MTYKNIIAEINGTNIHDLDGYNFFDNPGYDVYAEALKDLLWDKCKFASDDELEERINPAAVYNIQKVEEECKYVLNFNEEIAEVYILNYNCDDDDLLLLEVA